jgi:putative transposase
MYRYSLRYSTDARRPLFTRSEVVELVLSHFFQQAFTTDFVILAYCFMPDHVHLLIEGTHDRSDCRQFITRGKQYSGFYFAKEFGGQLWQRYGFERVLRDDESTLVVTRYILANPIRAGLVERVEDYPFLGSQVYSVKELLEAVGMNG